MQNHKESFSDSQQFSHIQVLYFNIFKEHGLYRAIRVSRDYYTNASMARLPDEEPSTLNLTSVGLGEI